MSKASTSSLQHLLRQLYLAKSASASSSSPAIEGAAAVISGGSSLAGRNVGGSSSNCSSGASAGGVAAFSTAARALHAASDAPSPSPAAIQHHHHAPLSASTGEWATSSTSSSNPSKARPSHQHHHRHHHQPPHHYHRHNANHHHVSSAASSSSNLLPPSFWIPTPPTGTSSSSSASAQPPFSSTSSTSNYSHAPASSSNSTLATSATSQPSDPNHIHTQHENASISDHQQNSKVSHSSLTLLPGAYGIPKRTSPGANAKGKGREVANGSEEADSIQAQISQLEQSLLSVQVGEDAYFVRHDALGVADGVGGWSGRKGADPGLFAARLMHHCSAELEQAERLASSSAAANAETGDGAATASGEATSKKTTSKLAFVSSASSSGNTDRASSGSSTSTSANGKGKEREPMKNGEEDGANGLAPEHVNASDTSLSTIASGDPIEVLHRAWDLTLTEFFDLELIGSSTALIALLKDDELRLANIGDCCCSIIRGEEYIFRSQEQQHSFNYPFQMGTNSKDTPRKDGQRFNIKVQKNDLVILSSDGLVDNLFDEDILEEVQRYSAVEEGGGNDDQKGDKNGRMMFSPERLSKALCSRAKAVSEDQRAVSSPFQQRANEEGIHFVGGKHDDITVLVAVIGDKSEVGV